MENRIEECVRRQVLRRTFAHARTVASGGMRIDTMTAPGRLSAYRDVPLNPRSYRRLGRGAQLGGRLPLLHALAQALQLSPVLLDRAAALLREGEQRVGYLAHDALVDLDQPGFLPLR